MGTNFYWKKLPKELKQYEKLVKTQTQDKYMNPLYHIGKRSGAGHYCMDCGTTFCIHGTSRIHYNDNPYELFSDEYEQAQKYYWYDKCPICGKDGTYICTFTWTFMKQKYLVNKLMWIYEPKLKQRFMNPKKLIVNEYDEEFTPYEFWEQELGNCPVEYQSCCEFC